LFPEHKRWDGMEGTGVMKNWRAEMAYAEGRVVLQGHADYCEANGHARHTVDGVEQVFWPRWGEPRDAELLPVSEAESRVAGARAAFYEDLELPYRPSVGTPYGWSEISSPEL